MIAESEGSNMTEAEANKIRIGSLVEYTHFGRHETEITLGFVTSRPQASATGNIYADVHWFDGTSHGVHPLLHSNISLINA